MYFVGSSIGDTVTHLFYIMEFAMKKLIDLFEDAAEFCRACNLRYVSIQRKNGNDSEYFLICNSLDDTDDDIDPITAYGVYSKAEDQQFFTFTIVPYKKWELSRFGIEPEDTDWEIPQEELVKIKSLINDLNDRIKDY